MFYDESRFGLITDISRKWTIRGIKPIIPYKQIERYNIKNISLLKFIIKYSFSNPATLFSFNKLYNELKTLGYKLSKDTLFDYFEYLNDAYTLFLTPIFRSSIKEENRNPKKLFIVDNGFNYIFNTSFLPDYSKLYENLVFLHLRRKYQEIYYFKEKQEVDFFVPQDKLLINVSYKIDNEKTLNREINALKEAMEKLKIESSLLVTPEIEKEVEGIKIIPIWKFLLDEF